MAGAQVKREAVAIALTDGRRVCYLTIVDQALPIPVRGLKASA
jgi:hypothetical protein